MRNTVPFGWPGRYTSGLRSNKKGKELKSLVRLLCPPLLAAALTIAIACADVDANTNVDVTVPLPERIRCWITLPEKPFEPAQLSVCTDTEATTWEVDKPLPEAPQLYYYDGFRRGLVTCEVLDGQE